LIRLVRLKNEHLPSSCVQNHPVRLSARAGTDGGLPGGFALAITAVEDTPVGENVALLEGHFWKMRESDK
jgi:hypothetical protein